jgi:hypothetical protein
MLAVGLVLAWQPARVIRFIHAHQGQALVTVIALHLSVVVLLPAFPLNQNLSLSRRVTLNQAAIAMIDQRPQGVGLQAFTTQLERVSQSREIVRFVQPVHHLGLLWLAETGLLGLVALGVGLIYLKRAQPTWLTGVILAAIWLLPVASLDHYLLTIQTGLLLSALVVSYSIFQAKNEQL